MPPNKTWKSVEARIASFFNTRRTPLSGSNSGHDTKSDTLSETFYIEVKYRKRHTANSLHSDTMTKAKAEGKVPISILVDHYQHGFTLLIHSSNLQQFCQVYLAHINSPNQSASTPSSNNDQPTQ